MRDTDCRIHVDSDDVSIFLLLCFNEIRRHGVRFSDVVNYTVSRARLRRGYLAHTEDTDVKGAK